MVTKAGVPSYKVIVGVSSYGRSFQMTSPSCTGPMCTYTGPDSGAEHGKCTGTGGYISNGEIDQIIADGRVTSQWTDDTRTDYVVFGGTLYPRCCQPQMAATFGSTLTLYATSRYLGCVHG